MIELCKNGADAVEAESACMIGRGDKLASKSVHLCKRANHAGVAEVVGKLTTSEAWAGCRLYADELVVCFAPQYFPEERTCEATEV